MSRVVELLCSRRVPHVAVLALMSIGFAGCSADMSRHAFRKIPLPPSLKPPVGAAAAVERRELPQYSRPQSQYQSQNLPPPIAAPQSYPSAALACPEEGAGSPPMLRRRVRSRPPARIPRSVARS